MFDFLRGTLQDIRGFQAILDVHDVGYCLHISAKTLAQLSEKKSQVVTLYTEHILTEFNETLYGFVTLEERDLFNRVRSVSRIGAKTALSVCSHLTYAEFAELIKDNDTKTLSKIPGIGPKSAQRVLMELAGKFTTPNTVVGNTQVTQDAISALTNLGYPHKQAKQTVEYIIQAEGYDICLETLITQALGKIIGG